MRLRDTRGSKATIPVELTKGVWDLHLTASAGTTCYGVPISLAGASSCHQIMKAGVSTSVPNVSVVCRLLEHGMIAY